jgi:hypothetical protein
MSWLFRALMPGDSKLDPFFPLLISWFELGLSTREREELFMISPLVSELTITSAS